MYSYFRHLQHTAAAADLDNQGLVVFVSIAFIPCWLFLNYYLLYTPNYYTLYTPKTILNPCENTEYINILAELISSYL